MSQSWRLDSGDTTLLVLQSTSGMPQIAWLGSKLRPDLTTSAIEQSIAGPNPKASLDTPVDLSLFPDLTTGHAAQAAFSGHRREGQQFAARFEWASTESLPHELVIHGSDPVAQLAIEISLSLDPVTSVVTIATTLINHGETLQLDWLASATLPLGDLVAECLSLHGRWGGEFQQQRQPLGYNRLQIENTRGRTSHEHFPGCVVGSSGFNEMEGQVTGVHLGWSGNYRLIVERLSNGKAYLQTGLALLPGEQRLEPGEQITTPPTYVCTSTGLNRMSQQFHSHARKNILPTWTRTKRPVHANSWEALYFNHDNATLLDLIDAAAGIGAERFVLDDGWFPGRRDDTAGLGDWTVDPEVYPDGLHALVERVRAHGMQFGLWFEPEMVNPDSQLYRAHPDWTLHLKDYTTPLARGQLVLNLALPEVQDYLYGCISTLVDEYDINYIKWDMNRDLVLPANGVQACAAAQPKACYALMEKLTTQFPDLEIESCSSGGARSDFGVLAHTGRIWTSDNIDPIDRLSIQRGFSLFFPPEIMGSHVGHDTAHLTGRTTGLDTRAIVALQGQYGFELDARKLSVTEQRTLAYYTNVYKQNRDWISESTSWRIETRNPSLLISGLVSQSRVQSLWFVSVLSSLAETSPENLVFRGLDSDKSYRVKILNQNLDSLSIFGNAMPAWTKEPVVLPGSLLMSVGLRLPVLPAQSTLLIECLSETVS